MKKLLMTLLCAGFAAVTAQAGVLLQDSLNYPYTNGCIEGQGQWYCYSPSNPYRDAWVTNNVLLTTTTNHDYVATPTNGFYNVTNGSATFVSFTFTLTALPSSTNGSYFFQMSDTNTGNNLCHLFVDGIGVETPGTYRLGIANYTPYITSEGAVTFPRDLATNTPYTVVVAFNTDPDADLTGAFLWINPSLEDYTNAVNNINSDDVYGTDTSSATNLTEIGIAKVEFQPYFTGGMSNLIVGTAFSDVEVTNAPVIGIQPLSTTNYTGNSLELFTIASGVDLTYQWYGPSGLLVDDGVNIIGSQSNILVLNNLTGAEAGNYYVVVTDAYGNSVTSSNAVTTIITTATLPFFPATVVAENLTNNVFTSAGFTNIAQGTGPLTYQWYFAPTNIPTTYAPLSGQTGPSLNLFLADYTSAGTYYVAVSNYLGGTDGPVSSITAIAPVYSTIPQLHNLELSIIATKGLAAFEGSTVYINTNNVVVSGYVTTYGGFGSTYTEFQIEDASGMGVEVYYPGHGNTNTPPVGSYITVTSPLEVYDTELELAPNTTSAIVVNTNVAPITIPPVLENANFNLFVTNTFGTNALNTSMSMVTFTNVYIYGSPTGGAFGSDGTHSGVGGVFDINSYNFLYFTVGAPYSATNTNTMEIYQFSYNYPDQASPINSPFYGMNIPTHCYQLTGTFVGYNAATAELEPSRPADYVINPPTNPVPAITITNTGKLVNLTWPVQTGSTYSVLGATNLAGPWTTLAYGLTYYPTNAAFVDTNNVKTKFYTITSP